MWTCPECGSKVDPSFEVCWNCGTSVDGVRDPTFVTADDQPPIEDPPVVPDLDADAEPASTGELPEPTRGEMVEAYRAFDLVEAQFLTDQLGEDGIHAVADTHDLVHQAISSVNSGPRVWVKEDDLPRARVWLESYERNKGASGDS